MALFTKRDLQFQKPYQNEKSEKYETLSVSKLLIWRQKWLVGVRHGNSLVAFRVSPGRMIVVSFWTKYFVPRQIKPGILKWTFRREKSNFSIVFIFVSCQEKDYLVSSREDSSGLIAARTAGAAAVCKAKDRCQGEGLMGHVRSLSLTN